MKKENYEKYSQIKQQIKELTDEAKALEKDIKTEMSSQDLDKVDSDYGSFSLSVRKSYEYTEKIDVMKEAVKESEKEERVTGAATLKETQVMTFRPIKN